MKLKPNLSRASSPRRLCLRRPYAQEAKPAAKRRPSLQIAWEQIPEGGWVMIPIGICSVLSFISWAMGSSA